MTSNWFAIHVGLEGLTSEEELFADITSHTLFEMGANGLEWRACEDGLEAVAALEANGATGIESLVSEVWQKVLERELPVGWVRVEPYADVDWSTHWRQHFTSLSFLASGQSEAEKLWVVPSWLDVPKEASKVLRIDPSSAFGTGIHATTSLCIEWLLQERPSSLLDIGTGTGILAFVAAMYGAKPVVAIDNDPEAVRVALQNCRLNQLDNQSIDISTKELHEISDTFQTVVANVLAQPLIDLAGAIVTKIAPGGCLALSGVLMSQTEEVAEAYVSRGLVMKEIKQKEEWALIIFTAKTP